MVSFGGGGGTRGVTVATHRGWLSCECVVQITERELKFVVFLFRKGTKTL